MQGASGIATLWHTKIGGGIDTVVNGKHLFVDTNGDAQNYM